MAERVPLVLLPGLLCDEALWRHQIAALADLAEAQVADLTRHESVSAMAQHVLESAPPRFALAALSMGGYVAFEIMRQAPACVSRLALLNTRAAPDTPEESRRRRGLIELAEKGKFKGVTPQLLPMLIHEERLEDAELTGIVLDMAERVGKTAFVKQQKAIIGRPDSQPSLATIDCPTLVLCGRQDALTPVHFHETMAEEIQGANLVVIEDCGHLSPLEQPESVTAALRGWLS